MQRAVPTRSPTLYLNNGIHHLLPFILVIATSLPKQQTVPPTRLIVIMKFFYSFFMGFVFQLFVLRPHKVTAMDSNQATYLRQDPSDTELTVSGVTDPFWLSPPELFVHIAHRVVEVGRGLTEDTVRGPSHCAYNHLDLDLLYFLLRELQISGPTFLTYLNQQSLLNIGIDDLGQRNAILCLVNELRTQSYQYDFWINVAKLGPLEDIVPCPRVLVDGDASI